MRSYGCYGRESARYRIFHSADDCFVNRRVRFKASVGGYNIPNAPEYKCTVYVLSYNMVCNFCGASYMFFARIKKIAIQKLIKAVPVHAAGTAFCRN